MAMDILWLVWQEGERIIEQHGDYEGIWLTNVGVGDVKGNECFRIRKLGKHTQILYQIQLSKSGFCGYM